jgi:hypothetical protein
MPARTVPQARDRHRAALLGRLLALNNTERRKRSVCSNGRRGRERLARALARLLQT